MFKRILTLFPVLFLVACNEEFGDLKAWMDESSVGLKGHIEPLPEVKPYEPFIYAAFDLVDPFNKSKMAVARKSGGLLAPNLNRPRETLESYDLEKLRMVGTLQRGKEINALIKAPDGNLYRIKMGGYMGQNFGMVTAISESEISLKEIVEDSGGDWVERTSVLALDETEQKK
jgi:type IV pilus assembly protein PilP